MKIDTSTSAWMGYSPSRGRALALGYVVCDVQAEDGQISYSAGGTSGNVAANLAVLGWQVSLQARIGTDPAGQVVRDDLVCAGVHLSDSFADSTVATPVVVVEQGAHTPRYRFRCPCCGTRYARHRPILAIGAAQLKDTDVVFFDRASSAAIQSAQLARESGKLVFFEPNTLGRIDLFRRAIGIAHIVKFSEQRALAFAELLDNAPAGQIQIRTQGQDGFSLRTPSASWRHFRAPKISAVDTVGAGDMFTAALLDLMIDDLDHPNCDVAKLVGPAIEAQWFAAANSRIEGARGLTRGRDRAEVFKEVVDLQLGRDASKDYRPLVTIKSSGYCEDWMCPTAASPKDTLCLSG